MLLDHRKEQIVLDNGDVFNLRDAITLLGDSDPSGWTRNDAKVQEILTALGATRTAALFNDSAALTALLLRTEEDGSYNATALARVVTAFSNHGLWDTENNNRVIPVQVDGNGDPVIADGAFVYDQSIDLVG